MRTTIMTAALAALATAVTLNAQAPQQPTTPQTQPQTERQRPATDSRANADTMQSVTITGCVKEEKDVAGRTPNPAERAGIGEDYLLTNVKMASGSSTSGIGLASMYQLKGVSDAELKKHIGHQVEVVGRLEGNTANRPSAGAGAGASGSTPAASRSDVPDFTATSIKMIAATCPAQ